MYRSIVRWRVQKLFAEANRGNFQAIIDALAPTFVYRFIGDTPLGGTRTTKAAMRAWFERIYRLVPDAQLVPQTVLVEGMPWNTQVMTYVKFRGTLPADGGTPGMPYENEVMQLMQLRWGRIVSVLTLEDTLRFAAILPALAAAGITDANAAPITDAPTSGSHSGDPHYRPAPSANRPSRSRSVWRRAGRRSAHGARPWWWAS
jgi:ketosteroid isomerase-like protein